MHQRGYALLEFVLVIGIIGVITGMAVPLYHDYEIRNDLNLATEQVTQGLARARLHAQTAQDDDGWGFYVPAGVLYKGNSYENRDQAFDEVYPMPSTITPTGILEVTYSKLVGKPSATGAITLTALNEEEKFVYITIETEAVAVVHNDNITICHTPPGNPGNAHTMTVSESAWPTHRDNHGDTLGPCSGGSSASSVSSSQSSASSSRSSASSSRSSTSSTSSAAATCLDRFTVDTDGTITTTATVNTTFSVLGSDVTYGEGGPEVNVYVSYKKGNGNSFTNLFSGNDVDGGESQTVSGFTSGSKIVVKVRGYYKHSGWLTFDQSYRSDDTSGHVVALRDGDTPPDYPAFNNQGSLEQFMQNILDQSGHINIGQYDIVLLVELGDLNSSAADFQDAVILLQFSQPNC